MYVFIRSRLLACLVVPRVPPQYVLLSEHDLFVENVPCSRVSLSSRTRLSRGGAYIAHTRLKYYDVHVPMSYIDAAVVDLNKDSLTLSINGGGKRETIDETSAKTGMKVPVSSSPRRRQCICASVRMYVI